MVSLLWLPLRVLPLLVTAAYLAMLHGPSPVAGRDWVLGLGAAAHGFLGKDAPPEQLLDAIRRTAAGESPFSAPVLRRLVRAAVDAHRSPTPRLPNLTDRERDVLALVADGLSNAEIADRLHVAVSTVKTHVAGLMTKTGATNRVRLALLATRV